jgi:hypothetical protein
VYKRSNLIDPIPRDATEVLLELLDHFLFTGAEGPNTFAAAA